MKALIFGKDRPGDPKRNTWRVVSGFPGEDEARAYAALTGGGNEHGAIKNSSESLQRHDVLIPDSVDYKDQLKESGLTKEFTAALKKLRDDRAEKARVEAENQERQRREREERERLRVIAERTQELRDQALQAELAAYRAEAEKQVDAELAKS